MHIFLINFQSSYPHLQMQLDSIYILSYQQQKTLKSLNKSNKKLKEKKFFPFL